MDLNYSDAAVCRQGDSDRTHQAQYSRTNVQCSNSNHSTGVRGAHRTRQSFALVNETYSTLSTKREWSGVFFLTINCFISTFFFLQRTDCSVLCLFIFVLWLCKLEVHSLFSKRPLVYGKLLSAYYIHMLRAADHCEQRSLHELHFVDRRSGVLLRINRFLCHYLL